MLGFLTWIFVSPLTTPYIRFFVLGLEVEPTETS